MARELGMPASWYSLVLADDGACYQVTVICKSTKSMRLLESQICWLWSVHWYIQFQVSRDTFVSQQHVMSVFLSCYLFWISFLLLGGGAEQWKCWEFTVAGPQCMMFSLNQSWLNLQLTKPGCLIYFPVDGSANRLLSTDTHGSLASVTHLLTPAPTNWTNSRKNLPIGI